MGCKRSLIYITTFTDELVLKLHQGDRDVNAAKNILAAGLAVNVCGATVRPEQSKSVKAGAMKQKL